LGLLAVVAATPAGAASFDCVVDPSLTLKLGSPVPGLLDEVSVERGALVTKGEIVARLESAVERDTVALNEARALNSAEIAGKEAILEQKRGVYGRKKSLQANNYASVQDIETGRAELLVAEQDLAVAKFNQRLAELELERSKALLEQRVIRSPIDGVVIKRSLGPGEYVHQEGNILTVARIDPLNVEAFLPVKYYGQVKQGDRVSVRLEDPLGGDRSAIVKVVDQVFDAASGTFGVRLELANPELIVPAGLRCKVSFTFPERQAETANPVASPVASPAVGTR
jgi:RND family efflux transporter MFP subunit